MAFGYAQIARLNKGAATVQTVCDRLMMQAGNASDARTKM